MSSIPFVSAKVSSNKVSLHLVFITLYEFFLRFQWITRKIDLDISVYFEDSHLAVCFVLILTDMLSSNTAKVKFCVLLSTTKSNTEMRGSKSQILFRLSR